MTGIINYGAGNIFSMQGALRRLGIPFGMVHTPADLDAYDRYIIPGVGHAGAAMDRLKQTGMAAHIPHLTKPVLGVCVGMQLLTEFSEEGSSSLLNVLPIRTLSFRGRVDLKVPHMGWNQVTAERGSLLFEGIPANPYFYFVHSYYIPYRERLTSAYTDYGHRFSAAFEEKNFYGVQFHPEKSASVGETLLTNFCKLH